MRIPLSIILLVALCLLALAACSGGDEPTPAPTAAPVPTPQPAALPTAVPAPTPQPAMQTQVPEPTSASAPTVQPAAPEPGSGGVVVTISEGSVARYSVTEQLARLSSPIDAVGETADVEGEIVFDSDGRIDPSRSAITVALAGLTSDESRRDRYVSERVFDTSRYPNAELVVTGAEGLDWPFPPSGETTFRLMSEMTIREVSSPVEWDVQARSSDGVVTGQAKTVVTFDQFELSKPALAFIVSVEDEIRLELDIEAAIESLSGQ